MAYSNLYFQRRNNTTLVVAALAVLLFFGYVAVGPSLNSIPTRAALKSLKRHESVNVLANQVSILWITEEEENGWIVYGKSPSDITQSAADERDLGETKSARTIHLVTIKDLEPRTQYFYKIISGNSVVKAGDTDYFSFKTASGNPPGTSVKPAFGKVIGASGNPHPGALVLYRYGGAYAQAAFTKLSGEWLIPLQQIADPQTSDFIPVDESELVTIEIFDGGSGLSTIEAYVRFTNPLPQTIILGKNYTFLKESDVLPAETSIAEEAESTGEYPVAITLPKPNAIIPATRPVLKGSAQPGKTVEISVNSEPGYIVRKTADFAGGWFVDVPVPFSPGSYKLTVKTEDGKGTPVTLTRSFTIAKSGEQVLGDATPSGTITPSATPSAEPTAQLTASPSPTDIVTPTQTPLPTELPTAVPSPSVLPTSGAFNPSPMLWGSAGMIIVGVGLLFVF